VLLGEAAFLFPGLQLLEERLVAVLEAVLGGSAVVAEARRRRLGIEEGAGEALHLGQW
jgi:hypothetical protein